jgi:hypothetical protein
MLTAAAMPCCAFHLPGFWMALLTSWNQHVKAVECMVADVLFAANHVLRIHELAGR